MMQCACTTSYPVYATNLNYNSNSERFRKTFNYINGGDSMKT